MGWMDGWIGVLFVNTAARFHSAVCVPVCVWGCLCDFGRERSAISQSINQFNSNLAAREPDSK